MTELHFGETGISFSATPYLVGVAKKFFEVENLRIDIVVSGQSALVCQQLLAKAIEIGDCSMNDVIQIVEMSGAPLILVANDVVTALNYAMLTDPFDSQAELEGYVRIDDLRPKYLKAENYAGGGVITTKDRALEHPEEIVAFIRALGNATAWIYDPANKDELLSILQARINVTREAFDRTYQKNIVQNSMCPRMC